MTQNPDMNADTNPDANPSVGVADPIEPVSAAEVLIVGAGPTGLTLGCLLRRYGVQVRLVDRLAAPAPLAKAMVVWSRSLEIMDEIGAAGPALEYCVPLERARYLVGDRLLASVRTNAIRGTLWQPIIIPQQDLEQVLRDRFEKLGPPIEWGTELVDLQQDADSAVATLHSPAGVSQLTVRYIVGADGIRSVVRGCVGIDWHEGAAYEEVFQLGDVTARTSLVHNQVHHFLGRRGVSVTIAMPNNMWRIAGYRDGEDPQNKPDGPELQELLETAGHHGTEVQQLHWAGTFRVLRRIAGQFRAGRAFIAGDAAHVHSPAGGQGLNTGIQDSYNLAWKLAFVLRGLAAPALLDTYNAERRPIAARILKMTELQDKYLFGARALPVRLLRNTLLRVLGGSGLLERRLIPDLAQLWVDYRKSRLTAGRAPRRSALRPGRRVPEVEIAAAGTALPTRLMQAVVGAAVTLIAVPGSSGAQPEGLAEVTARFPGAVRVLRLERALPDAARVPRSGYLLAVRPDGHVGFRGRADSAARLAAWLEGSLGLLPGAAGAADPSPRPLAGRSSDSLTV
jgi:2-polyprenyl-6-methoxyphenol hydroxylase-like FAD-dependent oxidoreductase